MVYFIHMFEGLRKNTKCDNVGGGKEGKLSFLGRHFVPSFLIMIVGKWYDVELKKPTMLLKGCYSVKNYNRKLFFLLLLRFSPHLSVQDFFFLVSLLLRTNVTCRSSSPCWLYNHHLLFCSWICKEKTNNGFIMWWLLNALLPDGQRTVSFN